MLDDRYVIACQRYIELNPLRARMVVDPADYPWSSHRATARVFDDALITPHRAWHTLGPHVPARCHAWRALVLEAVDPAETESIGQHLQRQHLYAPDRFRRAIEAHLGRSVGPGKIGRPAERLES